MCHSGGTPEGEDRVNRSSPCVPGIRGGSTLPATGTGTREAPVQAQEQLQGPGEHDSN